MSKHVSQVVVLGLFLVACGSEGGDVKEACVTACHPRDPNLAWNPLPSEGAPSARRLHAMVWTGKEVLVWGGIVDGAGNSTGDGAAYDPATDRWRPISTTSAPSARHSHQAVWTGTRMLVWGGFEKGGYAKAGGAYDPATDTWSAIPEAPIGGRTRQVSLWAGTSMLVWGGLDGAGALADGATYNLATGAWQKLPAGGPKGRASHVGVWTGAEVLVWGGTDTLDWFADGQHLDVAGNAWASPTTSAGAPSLRESATGIWTGREMLVWGGWNGGDYQSDGALYNPSTAAWYAMAAGALRGRSDHISIWTGDELVVWGGCTDDSCSTLLDDGGSYTRDRGWVVLQPSATLSARRGAGGVWTGRDVVVFGGGDVNFKPIGGGARATL